MPIQSLNLYVDRPRGGFGDVTSNLVMAEKLKEARASLQLNLVIHPDAADAMKILVPEFDQDQERPTLAGSPVFFEKLGEIPSADATISFATTLGSHLFSGAAFKESSPICLGYSEFGRRSSEDFLPAMRAPAGRIDPDLQFFRREFSPVFAGRPAVALILGTGADSNGIYISERKPSPPLSFAELRKRLERELALNDELLAWLQPDTLLGFAYTKVKTPEELYARGVVKASSAPEFSGKRMLVFVKDFPDLQLPQETANLRFIRYVSLSFQASRTLIACSAIPPMVTGDTSLSLAIDQEKFCFYEVNSWKFRSADTLASLIAGMPRFQKSAVWRERLYRCLLVDSKFPVFSEDFIAESILDREFRTEFESAIAASRKSLSLPRNVLSQLDALGSLELGRASKNQIVCAMGQGQEPSPLGGVDPGWRDGLIHAVGDPGLSPSERIVAFGALISSIHWEDPEFTEACDKLLRMPEARWRYALQNFLLFNMRTDSRVLELISRVLGKGSREARKEIVRIMLCGIAGTYNGEENSAISSDLAASMLRQHGADALPLLRELQMEAGAGGE